MGGNFEIYHARTVAINYIFGSNFSKGSKKKIKRTKNVSL